MAKKRLTFTDEIRDVIDTCGMTRYRIAKELAISESLLSRFMSGKGGLSMEKLDTLAEFLGIHVATGNRLKLKD
ncbi:MAG: helix-turn-helix domain-containing protein [Gemmataceae bacterium]|nr:helix-turn-helix domain-containing protein [Gemmataceae bacterium]MCI0742174.1 helix-turn-helix domain-containing protein [Gemmataceae bacterium]